MKIDFIIYPGFTMLDFVGAYDPLYRLSQLEENRSFELSLAAKEKQVTSGEGLTINAEVKSNVDLEAFDLVYVPGARYNAIEGQLQNDVFMQWLATAKNAKMLSSVCTGSILLGAAGLLKEHRATTHHRHLAKLEDYCQEVVSERIVVSKNVITGGGVSSAIDLGLFLVEKLSNVEIRQEIEVRMDYPYYPRK